MKIGYSRVSTARQGQPLETQREALLDAGCDAQHLHSDTISGSNWSRPGLSDALEYMRPGDTLVMTHLDRLGRNLHETVTTIADLARRESTSRCLSLLWIRRSLQIRLSSMSWCP